MSLKIAVIHGTNRPNNRSERVVDYFEKYISNNENTDVRVVKISELENKPDGNKDESKIPAYTEIVEWADAFIIVIPEYNHSFPGSLKQLLDKEYEFYRRKAVGLVGVSNGGWGGTRAVEHIKPVLNELGLSMPKTAMYFPRVSEIIDNDSKVLDETLDERTETFLNDVMWLASALKWGRENLE